MNFRIFDSVADLVQAAAREIVRRAASRTSFRIALSGGATPEPLYALLGSAPLRDQLTPLEIDWIVGDERCVPIDNPASNAGMILRTLFAHGIPEKHHFLRFPTEEGDPERIAAGFERAWKERGIERLDLAIQGMGEDGHTASLFPGTSVLEVRDRIAAPVYVPRLDSWRVTLTLPVLEESGAIMVLAAGAGKRAVIEQLRAGWTNFPIARVTSAVEDTWWFTDRAAAEREVGTP
jgi:6-phosphogluconolactonase